MRRSFLLLLFVPAAFVACAARTEIGDTVDDEPDSSLLDAPPPIDVSPPPDDAIAFDVSPPPPPDDAQPPPPPIDAAPPPIDAPDDVEVPSCPDTCFNNHQCEQQCTPHLQSGRYCCDDQTNTCYAWSGKHCPIQVFDAGFD